MKKIIYYETLSGDCPYRKWYSKLDNSMRAKVTIRLERVENGNYGDFKRIDSKLSELRFTVGKGYRIYFTEYKNTIVIILSGGDKSSQSKDIQRAKIYIKDLNERQENE